MDGMRVIPLKKLNNERGHLLEVQRFDDSHYLGFAQAYMTATKHGVIKGWYRHLEQTDQIAIIKGIIYLVLYDTRDNSSTIGAIEEIRLDSENPKLVQFPPGIWHSFKTLSSEDAYLLHLNDHAYDFSHPDEERLPHNTSLIPYRWEPCTI